MTDTEILQSYCADDALFNKLMLFISEIELFNDAYGLVKVRDRKELIVKHILDSLAPLPLVKKILTDRQSAAGAGSAAQIADAGSGAGFPGIPLSFCFPDAAFTLIEKMGRRAGFLRNCAAVLGTGNISVRESEMEKLPPSQFDLVVFRAFRPLEPDITKALLRLLKPNGCLAAWKGRLTNINTEMSAFERNFPDIKWEVHPVDVPFLEEERNLVVIWTS